MYDTKPPEVKGKKIIDKVKGKIDSIAYISIYQFTRYSIRVWYVYISWGHCTDEVIVYVYNVFKTPERYNIPEEWKPCCMARGKRWGWKFHKLYSNAMIWYLTMYMYVRIFKHYSIVFGKMNSLCYLVKEKGSMVFKMINETK